MVRRALVLLVLLAAAGPTTAASAATPPPSTTLGPLRVGVVLELGTGAMRVRVRCRARSACRGRIDVAPLIGRPLAERPVALAAGEVRWLDVRLTTARLVRALSVEHELETHLRRPGRPTLEGLVAPRIVTSCRVGETVAEQDGTRLVRVPAVGLLACAPGAERGWTLEEESGGIAWAGTDLQRLALPFAAYVASAGHRCSSTRVVVTDLRTRRGRRLDPGSVTSESDANGCVGIPTVAALVLRPTGAVAWSTEPGGPGVREVWRAGPGATVPERLDAASEVEPTSLSLAGTTVTWRTAGLPRAAELP